MNYYFLEIIVWQAKNKATHAMNLIAEKYHRVFVDEVNLLAIKESLKDATAMQNKLHLYRTDMKFCERDYISKEGSMIMASGTFNLTATLVKGFYLQAPVSTFNNKDNE